MANTQNPQPQQNDNSNLNTGNKNQGTDLSQEVDLPVPEKKNDDITTAINR